MDKKTYPYQLNGGKPMYQVSNFTENDDVKVLSELGAFQIIEYQRDLSVSPSSAVTAYFSAQMNVKKRQLVCHLHKSHVTIQAGAMQWAAGQVESETGVKGVGDFIGKAFKGAVTNESAVKPIYRGSGFLMLEPTYRYIILEDIGAWEGGIVLDDGLFLACDASLDEKIVSRTNASSAFLGGEGLFNLSLTGQGIAVLESPVPREELLEIEVQNDTVKIDGNMAIAWSSSLQFTVEKSSKSLMGSAINGEGFVNVYRGTGKILLAPTINGTTMSSANGPKESSTISSKGLVSSVVKSALDL